MWKKQHRHYDYFGRSAIVCQNENETNGPYNFIPVQRIAYRCAHLQMKLKFDDFDETVFIANSTFYITCCLYAYNINDCNSNIKMSIAVHKHIIMYVHHNNMHMHVLCDIEFTRDQPPLFQ